MNDGAAPGAGDARPLRRLLIRLAMVLLTAGSVAVQPTPTRADSAQLTVKPSNKPITRNEIRSLQRMLAAHGYDPGTIDGFAGSKTVMAIRDYQMQANLEVDGRISMGLVGHLTIESVKLAQGMLSARGYDAGPVDGDIGRKTTLAIREYQARAGLVVDGKFSLNLLDHLDASSGRSARAPDYAGQGSVVTGYRRGDIEPIYEIGDAFAYSDGQIETVVRVGGNLVRWQVADGEDYAAYRNFLLPRVAWQTSEGKGESTIDLDIDEAWPATARKQVSFSVSMFWTLAGASGSATRTSESWRCQRRPGKRVTVAAGIFETIPITCERTGAPPDLWHKRIWYYAPAVRHFVRKESISAEETRQIDLVAIRPGAHGWPAAARAGLGEAVQATLENGAIGEEVSWGSTAIGAKFGIKPTGELNRDDGVHCRSYVLIRSDVDNSRAYPAVACRAAESEPWLVPFLDRDRGAISAQLSDRP